MNGNTTLWELKSLRNGSANLLVFTVAMSLSPNNELTSNALKMAYESRE